MTRRAGFLPTILVPHPHVRVDQNVLSGSPYVAGTRVPVRRLWGFYRGGAGVDTLIKRYPQLGAGKIFDALAFAWDNPEVMEADLLREAHFLQSDPRPSVAKPGSQMALPFSDEKKAVR